MLSVESATLRRDAPMRPESTWVITPQWDDGVLYQLRQRPLAT